MGNDETKKPESDEKPEGERPEKGEKGRRGEKGEKGERPRGQGGPEAGMGAEAGERPESPEGDEGEGKRVDPKALKAVKKEKKAQAQADAEAAGGQQVPAKKEKEKGKKDQKEKKAGGPAAAFVKRSAPPALRRKYREEIVPEMIKKFGYTSPMAVPRLVKITLNMGLGEALQNPKLLDSAEAELAMISGQKPVITKARKSIATFKLRQGQKIGVMVTLRRERMFEFLERLVTLALPRTRDFKGISPKSFDGRGNFALGIREQIIFPEIDYDKIEKIMGLNVCIVTTARTDEEGRELLRQFGMPFR